MEKILNWCTDVYLLNKVMDIKLEPVDDGYIAQSEILSNELWYDVPIETSDIPNEIKDVTQPITSEIVQTVIKEEYEEISCRVKTEIQEDGEFEKAKKVSPIKPNALTWAQDTEQVLHNAFAIKLENYDAGECSYTEPNEDQGESEYFESNNELALTEIPFSIENSKKADTSIIGNPEKAKKTKLTLKRFTCDQCDFKSTHLSDLKTHKLSHTGEKPFKCGECDYRTVRSSRLKTHKMTHTGEKPMKCDQCSFSCARTSHLKIHKMLHSGEKPYKCDQCDYKSAQSFHLKTHKMSHTGEKPFKCDQCDYRSAISYTLKTHKLSHSGEKPFRCDQCDYKTTFSFSLKTHKMLHSGEKPFKCDVCDFKSARAYDLKRHQKSHSKLK